jgi:hypothetical protein
MKNKKETIKNMIIEKYNKINKDNPDIIDLLKPAKDIKNTFFEDFKKELEKARNPKSSE